MAGSVVSRHSRRGRHVGCVGASRHGTTGVRADRGSRRRAVANEAYLPPRVAPPRRAVNARRRAARASRAARPAHPEGGTRRRGVAASRNRFPRLARRRAEPSRGSVVDVRLDVTLPSRMYRITEKNGVAAWAKHITQSEASAHFSMLRQHVATHGPFMLCGLWGQSVFVE